LKFVPPGPLKEWLDQVLLLNAGFNLVRKLGTVLALLFPGAPDTSPAFYGAIVAVLAGRKMGGFRDLPDGGTACKVSRASWLQRSFNVLPTASTNISGLSVAASCLIAAITPAALAFGQNAQPWAACDPLQATPPSGRSRNPPIFLPASGTPRGPSNAPPGLQPRSAPVATAAHTQRQNKTTLDLSNASKNRLKSGLHALFNGSARFPIDCKFCHRLRTNKHKKAFCIKELEGLLAVHQRCIIKQRLL